MFFCLDDESHGPGTWRGECFGLCPGHWERRGLQLQLCSPSFGSVDAFGFGPQIGLLGRNGLSPVLFLVCLSHLLSASVVRGQRRLWQVRCRPRNLVSSALMRLFWRSSLTWQHCGLSPALPLRLSTLTAPNGPRRLPLPVGLPSRASLFLILQAQIAEEFLSVDGQPARSSVTLTERRIRIFREQKTMLGTFHGAITKHSLAGGNLYKMATVFSVLGMLGVQ